MTEGKGLEINKMTAMLKTGDSVPSMTERLSLFALPPTETGVEKKYYVNYRPVSQIVDSSAPVEFSFGGDSGDMIDLKHSDLHCKVKITTHDDQNVTKNDLVAPVNQLLHSLWEKVDITLQGKTMTHTMGSYPYAAYIKNIKCLGADSNHLETIGFKLDSGDMDATGLMPKKDPTDATEVRTYNGGASHRGKWFYDGKTFQMEGPLLADVCQIDRYLLNNTDVGIKLYKNRSNFIIGAKDDTKEYKVVIEDIYFKTCYVKPSPGVLLGISKALDGGHKALYPYTKTEARIFNIPQGFQDIYLDNVFQGIVPGRIIIGMVSSSAKNGKYTKNPFNFQPFDVREIGVSVDGNYRPAQPTKVNFTEGQNYVTAYRNFVGCMSTSANDVGITMDAFKNGFALFSFRLDEDREETDPEKSLALIKHGSVRLELSFGSELKETVSLIVFAEYPSMFQIDKTRKVDLV